MKTSRIVEREIIREIRLKLRLYFPELQSFIDKKIITKNDWIFFGMIQLNLVKCFTITPEDAIRKSKAQINQITKFYELETRVRKTALSSNSFLKENDLNKLELSNRMVFYNDHRKYWKTRKDSSELYFNYEVFLFLYYKWMKSFELDKESSISLILDIMMLSNYYSKNYFDFDRLSKERVLILKEMKISSGALLIKGKNGQNIIGATFDNDNDDKKKFIREMNAHLL
ncbi:hypothetical protein N9W06_04520 [Candidatus Marinimicrobia bacterium]|nr:hypothetical protein [Candidatus Neomarinimicrobiota bacterium]|tara:strand:+ start:5641 stop:6324 length:684 start_codon:yes stop_codon:yes gene_type:complete